MRCRGCCAKGRAIDEPPEPAWQLTALGRAQDLERLARTARQQARALAALRERASTTSELKAHDVAAATLDASRGQGLDRARAAARSRAGGRRRAGLPGREPELTTDQRDVLAAIAATQATHGRFSRLSAARRHGQRQDRDLPAAHRGRARGRPADAPARAGDRPDAAARAPPARALRRRARRAALGRYRARAIRRVAARLPLRSAPRRRHTLGRVRAVAVAGAHHRRRGARRVVQAADAAFATRRAISPSCARSGSNVPVVLGSATPSLETFNNAAQGRYQKLSLPRRIGSAGVPQVRVVDLEPPCEPASVVDAAGRRHRPAPEGRQSSACCS